MNLRRNANWPFMLVLAALLAACSVTPQAPVVQKCPAIKPVGIECDREWTFDRSQFPDRPSPIEALEAAYARALALLEDGDAALKTCRARDQVWDDGWEGCGE